MVLPVHYNSLIQGLIYRHLDRSLAQRFHEQGFSYHKRRFKLFTFSRLISKNPDYIPERRELVFKGPIHLWIGAMEVKFLESLASHLVKRRELVLEGQSCYLVAVEVEMPLEVKEGPVVVRTLSPLTVHRTFFDPRGRRKTRFFHPSEAEFERLVFDNLLRKARAFYGEKFEAFPVPTKEFYLRPLSLKKEVITRFKGTLIKGWDGFFELSLPEPLFTLAYNAGLGARNSQGFGMIYVVIRKGALNVVNGQEKSPLSRL